VVIVNCIIIAKIIIFYTNMMDKCVMWRRVNLRNEKKSLEH